jgi:hypothetical protein
LAERERPEPSAGKEVALGISHKVGWFDIGNAAFIHVPQRDGAILDGLAHNLRFERIDFVVVSRHVRSMSNDYLTAHNQRPFVP